MAYNNIGFSGHRTIKDPADLNDEQYRYIYILGNLMQSKTWIHGGAIGFDSIIQSMIEHNNINHKIIKPDYEQYGKKAPLIRNDEIVNLSDILYVYYEYTNKGGTYYTINKAKEKGIKVFNIYDGRILNEWRANKYIENNMG